MLSIDRDRFVAFLLEAKRCTYAAGGEVSEKAVMPLMPGSHQLDYRDGDLLYRDVYFGGAYFVGQETVFLDEEPIWSMCYAGGFTASLTGATEEEQVGAFLQAALREVTAEHPYRGPLALREGAYLYDNEVHGKPERFWGLESIHHRDRDQVLYELRYCGGALR